MITVWQQGSVPGLFYRLDVLKTVLDAIRYILRMWPKGKPRVYHLYGNAGAIIATIQPTYDQEPGGRIVYADGRVSKFSRVRATDETGITIVGILDGCTFRLTDPLYVLA